MVFSNNLPFENEFAEKLTHPLFQNLTLSEVYMGLPKRKAYFWEILKYSQIKKFEDYKSKNPEKKWIFINPWITNLKDSFKNPNNLGP